MDEEFEPCPYCDEDEEFDGERCHFCGFNSTYKPTDVDILKAVIRMGFDALSKRLDRLETPNEDKH